MAEKSRLKKSENIKTTTLIAKVSKVTTSYPKTYKYFVAVVVSLGLLYLLRSFLVVSLVNNFPITRFAVIKELEKQGGSQVLDSLINERLILQEAAKKNVKITQGEVDAEIGKIEENLKTQGSDLETALSMQGQTKQDLVKAINLKILIEKTLADKIAVTDQEVQSYFDSNKAALYKDKKFEDVKTSIVSVLEQQKLSAEYQKWITEIKQKAKIISIFSFSKEAPAK